MDGEVIERPRKLVRSDTAAILACSVRVFLQTGHSPQRPDCLAGHVGLEVRRETGKE